MRDEFISNAGTNSEKEFWKQFFEEINKRSFVRAKFNKYNFGVRINNKHIKKHTKSYSLMYTRDGSFKMNNQPYDNNIWDGLNRLKHWCITPNLPEKFYSDLIAKKLLLDDEFINVPLLLKSFTPVQLNDELFQCIDLFK